MKTKINQQGNLTMKTIDLFAGAGGSSTGAMMAGCEVLWAANHWLAAVQVHKNNHPDIDHICQDLHQADWSMVPAHDLMLASPCCQGHSKARGKDRAHHDASRSTAWAIVSCAEYHKPEFIIVENTTEFLDWQLFPVWNMAMETMGYTMFPHEIDAADCGVPQNRKRIFLVGTRSKTPIQLKLKKRSHVGARNVIDFESGKWSLINKPGRAESTLARVKNGRARFGDQFVMPYYGSGSGKTGRDLDRPIGTVTTRDRWAVVDGDRMRMVSAEEYKVFMGFPKDYQLPSANKKLTVHLIGNAVCPPVMRDLITELKAA
jgi:DNA (cytosine-5)-methyltransferase 1